MVRLDSIKAHMEISPESVFEYAKSHCQLERAEGWNEGFKSTDAYRSKKTSQTAFVIITLLVLLVSSIIITARNYKVNKGAYELGACSRGDAIGCMQGVADSYDLNDKIEPRGRMYLAVYKSKTGKDLPGNWEISK